MNAYIPLSEIAKQLNLQQGRVIYLASDLVRLASIARKNNERLDPIAFLSSFTEQLGQASTLLVPTFNFDLRKNAGFDVLNTQPITGILAQYALKAPGFTRSYNALHSFAVWGKHAAELAALRNQSSFAEDSPFGFLYREKALMLAIDLDLQASLTFAHYTEEAEQVKYRSWKKIPINYTDAEGTTEKQFFKLFAKKAGYINNVNPIEQALMQAGAIVQQSVNGVNCMLVDLHLAHAVITDDLRNNKGRNIVFFNTKTWAKSLVKTAIGKK